MIFERVVLSEDKSRPPPKYPEDKKGSLAVARGSSNVFCVTGTPVHFILGDEKDLVIQTRCFVRFWNTTKGKLCWERKQGVSNRLLCICDRFVVSLAGYYHLRQRHNGYIYGRFDLPRYSAFVSLKSEDHFGPLVSKQDLVLYQPSKKVIFIFSIGDRSVKFRAWESTDEIRGPLILRGSLENLELELIGKTPVWRKHEMEVPIWINWDPIRKYLLDTY